MASDRAIAPRHDGYARAAEQGELLADWYHSPSCVCLRCRAIDYVLIGYSSGDAPHARDAYSRELLALHKRMRAGGVDSYRRRR